jgi:hypothetical protein
LPFDLGQDCIRGPISFRREDDNGVKRRSSKNDFLWESDSIFMPAKRIHFIGLGRPFAVLEDLENVSASFAVVSKTSESPPVFAGWQIGIMKFVFRLELF